MKLYKNNESIQDKDIMFAVASNTISITILFLPRYITEHTVSSDGWIAILFGGLIALLLGWILAKIAVSFPNEPFFSFASYLVSKPVAVILCFIFVFQYIIISSFQMREMATLSQEYFFDRTPLEVVCLAFILVVIYAVSGSRVAIFKLNILFFPFVVGGLILLIIAPMWAIKLENLLPVFQTDFKGLQSGTISSLNAFLGFGIVIFYISLIKKPEKAAKMTVLGILFPFTFYIIIFIICVGVFGNATVKNLYYPVFELSKIISIPGIFFERFDSILFIIWTIIVFTTCLMAFDIAVMLINQLIPKLAKQTVIFILSPIIFFLAMIPKNFIQINNIAKYMAYLEIIYMVFVIFLLGTMLLIRGRRTHDPL
ncbi:endospore germination permease [Solibacillus sp. FSL W8-0474]|uniref:GerAB/ArcD/ProY family transporter n=1 Tax=Solibacillus sp. FSL W8-0474 TaxID=2975336 RepID=UPI0030FC06C3